MKHSVTRTSVCWKDTLLWYLVSSIHNKPLMRAMHMSFRLWDCRENMVHIDSNIWNSVLETISDIRILHRRSSSSPGYSRFSIQLLANALGKTGSDIPNTHALATQVGDPPGAPPSSFAYSISSYCKYLRSELVYNLSLLWAVLRREVLTHFKKLTFENARNFSSSC